MAKLGAEAPLVSVLVLTAAAVSLIDLVPATDYGVPALRAALETAVTLFALGGAWLLRAEFVYSRRLRDLMLVGTLLMLATISLLASALPATLNHGIGGEFTVVSMWGELFVAAAFAVAASAPADRMIAGGRPLVIVAILSVIALGASQLGGLLLGSQFLSVGPHAASQSAGAAQHPLELVVVLSTMGLFTCGAVMFASQETIEHSGFGRCLAGAGILLAAVSFSHLGLPFPAAQRVASREVVRLFASALMLAAALRIEFQTRQRVARAAAIAERRRVARDLHDGLAQDLAFIAAHGARISEKFGEEHPVAVAARRALAASRFTIAELSHPAWVTAQEALEAIAYELGRRFDMQVAVHVDLDGDIDPDAREQVARITREAIANAARHGGAENVVVSLTRTNQGVVLRVIDDGSGIDNTRPGVASEGFGLRSMRERAQSLGGYLNVRRPNKRGTELEVVLP